ncbi:NADP-dependent oxidoreductase [Micropruina sp.]|uniref:NADP-dependent oxidoreductase n=1 Tax=Micropruina sp. TaxID=2737536 RepID=UPI0039E3E37F
MASDQMWAVQYRKYGGPEVLEVGQSPVPRPGARQVLVEVAACSLNQADLMARAGKLKGLNGFGFPKGTGVDFAGTIVRTGARVPNLTVGDRVWGYLGMKPPGRHAAAAQYLTIRADQIAVAPSRVPLEEAAALPLVGLTAVAALRALRVDKGNRVLVVGGNGGVGSTAIQVARAQGARVDALTGDRNAAATQAGATSIYDYREGGAAQITQRYDAILATASDDLLVYRTMLNPGGRIVALSPSAMPAIFVSMVSAGPLIRMVSGKPHAGDLTWLASRVDDGSITPIIEATYSVDRVSEAHRDAESRSANGKRVIVTSRA